MDFLTTVHWPLVLAAFGGFALGLAVGYLLRAWRVEDVPDRAPDTTRFRAAAPYRTAPSAPRWTNVRSSQVDARPDHQPAAAAGVEARTSAVPGDWDNEGEGPQVLLVDDRLEMLGVYAAYLRVHGYRVLLAENGRTALAFARAYHPALIVLDHSMPDRTGLEVARELKADRATKDIPILMMTAHSYGAVGAAAIAAGCVAFLPKPVEPSRLLREIETRAPKH